MGERQLGSYKDLLFNKSTVRRLLYIWAPTVRSFAYSDIQGQHRQQSVRPGEAAWTEISLQGAAVLDGAGSL